MWHKNPMTSMRNTKPYCLGLFFCALLFFPQQALALQSHGPPEGIYVHQLAHIFFLAALCYLLWDIRRNSFPDRGWRYLQLFCLFMIVWNIVAFTGHWFGNSIMDQDLIQTSGYLSSRVANPITPQKDIYSFTKLDHIFIVPAMICLYLCLRSLYHSICNGEER